MGCPLPSRRPWAGPTAISTSFAPVTSDGAPPFPTSMGEATSSTPGKARLDDVLEDIGTKTLRYVYDFGDGWEHTITIERLPDPEPAALYPRRTDVHRRC